MATNVAGSEAEAEPVNRATAANALIIFISSSFVARTTDNGRRGTAAGQGGNSMANKPKKKNKQIKIVSACSGS